MLIILIFKKKFKNLITIFSIGAPYIKILKTQAVKPETSFFPILYKFILLKIKQPKQCNNKYTCCKLKYKSYNKLFITKVIPKKVKISKTQK